MVDHVRIEPTNKRSLAQFLVELQHSTVETRGFWGPLRRHQSCQRHRSTVPSLFQSRRSGSKSWWSRIKVTFGCHGVASSWVIMARNPIQLLELEATGGNWRQLDTLAGAPLSMIQRHCCKTINIIKCLDDQALQPDINMISQSIKNYQPQYSIH